MTRWVVRTLNKKKPVTIEAGSWDHDKDGWIGFFKEGASLPFVWFNHLDVLQITCLEDRKPACPDCFGVDGHYTHCQLHPPIADGQHTYVLAPSEDSSKIITDFGATNYRADPPT